MSFISKEQEKEIINKGLYQIVNPCLKEKNPILDNSDAFKRYIGFRKKIIFYNNSNLNIVVCIKPAPHCFMTGCSISKNMSFTFSRIGNYEPTKIIISPKSYQNILVPTSYFLLTICVKSATVIEENTDYESDAEDNFINNIFNFAVNLIGNAEERITDLINKGLHINSNQKWKMLIEDYPLDTSYDIFLNERQLGDLKILEEVDYNSIGTSNI